MTERELQETLLSENVTVAIADEKKGRKCLLKAERN
jgi:hypothetical protein